MIRWNARFEVGISAIDEQHKLFISKINELGQMTKSTNPTVGQMAFVIDLVDFIESYADNHFRHEENCMERFRCPVHEINMGEHQAFLASYREFKKRWASGGYSTETLTQLHRMTSDWIQKHILGVDVHLREVVGRCGDGGSGS
jgi:hemerythrin